MAKANIIFLIVIFLTYTFVIGTVIYVVEKAEEANIRIYENQNIEFYYYCPDIYVSQYYLCGKGLTYENLTGKYCNGTLVCENDYKILEENNG